MFKKFFTAVLSLSFLFSPLLPVSAATNNSAALTAAIEAGGYTEVTPYKGYLQVKKLMGDGVTICTGLLDYDGNVVLPCEYRIIESPIDGLSRIVRKDAKEGVFNLNSGKIVAEPGLYSYIETTVGGFSEVTNFNKIVYRTVSADYIEAVFHPLDGWATGLIDRNGNLVIPLKYESIQTENGKFKAYGFFDKVTGHTQIDYYDPVMFDEHIDGIALAPEGSSPMIGEDSFTTYTVVLKDGKYGLVDQDHQYVIQPIYKFIQDAHIAGAKTLTAVNDEGMHGGVGFDGRIRVPFIYEAMSAFFSVTELDRHGHPHEYHIAYVKRADGKYMFINEDNVPYLDMGFDRIHSRHFIHTDNQGYTNDPVTVEGIALAIKDGFLYSVDVIQGQVYPLYDADGTPSQYTGDFPDMLAAWVAGYDIPPYEKPGMQDYFAGNLKYDYQHSYTEGLAPAYDGLTDSWVYLNEDGQQAFPQTFLSKANGRNTQDYIDVMKGWRILGYNAEKMRFIDGLAKVTLYNNRYEVTGDEVRVINTRGETVLTGSINGDQNGGRHIYEVAHGFISATEPEGSTVYNRQGKRITGYHEMRGDFTFFGGYAFIKESEGRLLGQDEHGNPKYDETLVVYDQEGNPAPIPPYTGFYPMKKGYYSVRANGKAGAVDENLNVIIPLEYSGVDRVIIEDGYGYSGRTDTDLIRARIGDKWGLIDYRQNIIAPIEYDRIDVDNKNKRLVLVKGTSYTYLPFDSVIPQ